MTDPLNNGFAFIDYRHLPEQIDQMKEAARKASDTQEALALVKKADAALALMEKILDEMRGIAVEAATNPHTDRGSLDERFQRLKKSLDNAVQEADYGGYNLLDGSLGNIREALDALEKALKP